MLARKGSTTTISFNSSKSLIIGTVNKERLLVNSPGTLDNESPAELVLPGLYCIVKLKGMSFNTHFWYSASTSLCSSKKRRLH